MSEASVTELLTKAVAHSEDDSVIKENVQRNWRSYIWDTLDKSPEERKFLFKLDAALLTFASLGKRVLKSELRRTLIISLRILHQVFRPGKHQQCLRIRNVSKKQDS